MYYLFTYLFYITSLQTKSMNQANNLNLPRFSYNGHAQLDSTLLISITKDISYIPKRGYSLQN